MARIYSWDGRLLRALCNGFLCRLAVQHRDTGTGLQLVLSVDHDLLVGLEAGVNECFPATDLSDLDRPGLARVVGIDDVHISSARTLLYGRCGDGQTVVPCIDEQPRVDEF